MLWNWTHCCCLRCRHLIRSLVVHMATHWSMAREPRFVDVTYLFMLNLLGLIIIHQVGRIFTCNCGWCKFLSHYAIRIAEKSHRKSQGRSDSSPKFARAHAFSSANSRCYDLCTRKFGCSFDFGLASSSQQQQTEMTSILVNFTMNQFLPPPQRA